MTASTNREPHSPATLEARVRDLAADALIHLLEAVNESHANTVFLGSEAVECARRFRSAMEELYGPECFWVTT